MSDAIWETLDRDLEEFRRRLRVQVRKVMREALGEGVGSAAFHIVEALERRGPMSPSDLASALQVRTSTMASHLDRLEELGWLRREAASPGTNRVRVLVTPSGRSAIERYVVLRRGVLRDVLAPLPPQQVAALAQALHACVQAQRDDADPLKEAP
jgi:DNA-binding MarR family transcriptional regulator